jgi:hypothetical protein
MFGANMEKRNQKGETSIIHAMDIPMILNPRDTAPYPAPGEEETPVEVNA